jgi:Na+/melibiose symporter-like transporter
MTLRAGIVARDAMGSVGTGGFATLPGLVLVFYLTDTLGVTALVAGVIVTAAKVWDVFVDPIIGAASDRDLAATGGRRRLMLVGALLLPIFFTLTFAVPPDLSLAARAVWVLVAFVLAATAFSLFQVPYMAIPAEIAGSYDERTRLLTARVVVLAAAILAFGGGAPALRSLGGDDERLGYLVMALAAGIVLGAGMLVASGAARGIRTAAAREAAGTPSARLSPVAVVGHYRDGMTVLRESAAFRALLATFVLQALATGVMLAAAQYVATWVLHSTEAITLLFAALIAPALVCTPLWGRAARRHGKEQAFAFASVLFGVAALALTALAWAPGPWVYAAVGVAGAAYAGMQSLPMSMLPDVVAHDSRVRGTDRAGRFGGVWTAGETGGLALGTTVLTIVLALTGYAESTGAEHVEQSTGAVLGIVASFSLVPALLIVASLLTLRRYPLRRADIDVPVTGVPAAMGGTSEPPGVPGALA